MEKSDTGLDRGLMRFSALQTALLIGAIPFLLFIPLPFLHREFALLFLLYPFSVVFIYRNEMRWWDAVEDECRREGTEVALKRLLKGPPEMRR